MIPSVGRTGPTVSTLRAGRAAAVDLAAVRNAGSSRVTECSIVAVREVVVARSQRQLSASALLGSLEYPIMRALWERFPLTVGDVLDRLNDDRSSDDELAYTTVMTVLSRLHDKGILAREKQGRSYEYRPRCTEDELVRQHSRNEVQDLVARYGPVALAQFATALQDAQPELLARLVRLAEEGADG